MLLQIWQSVVLGLVEGITEYLPVSSTGHLILASSLMGLDTPEARGAIDDFEIVIQGGAILAVVGLYWPSCLKMLRGLFGKDPAGLRLFFNLTIAFIPSAAVGFILHDWIDEHLFRPWAVMLALVLGGAYMMIVDLYATGRVGPVRSGLREKTIEDVTPAQALFIGILQCVSLWPGTSRSMMTITGAVMTGLRPRQAAEFSFLLGLPTLSAATAYKVFKNLHHAHHEHLPNMFDQLGWGACAVGIGVAAISAAIAVRWLVAFLNRHGLTPFGVYRMALCVLLLILLRTGLVTMESSSRPLPSPTQTVPKIDWKGVDHSP